MHGRSKRTSTREGQFLAALAAGWSVTKAAEAIGIARRTAYDWRDTGADFAKLWDDAVEAGTDLMEDEAVRRAVEGVPRPVFYQGKVVGSMQEYSDYLLIRMLRAGARRSTATASRAPSATAVRVVEVTSSPTSPRTQAAAPHLQPLPPHASITRSSQPLWATARAASRRSHRTCSSPPNPPRERVQR